MKDDSPQKELLEEMSQLLKRFDKSGDLAPIEDREAWEKLVESRPPQERELVKELARFVDLWRYFQERKESLGLEIVAAMSEVHRLPVAERIARISEINQKLLEKLGDAGPGTQFRH
ncbi:MAG TPA: hypothetical protein VKH81_04195 [Candidatus Angelobacter sp.]|nr:hypothetical protein [Candidatus Angelobacter sp.]